MPAEKVAQNFLTKPGGKRSVIVKVLNGQAHNGSELPGNDLRQRIVDELPVTGSWWNTATRAEALLGLGRYVDAANVLKAAQKNLRWTRFGEKRKSSARNLQDAASRTALS